ncbi:205 kDa microtubule-associated protein-like, partial [Prorops nasuta]|uniref:205 kDa microtubule-associated protein-like n=1 Tax=Prorops nasuta TaxID=863751 RepID=UPI0034CF6B7E
EDIDGEGRGVGGILDTGESCRRRGWTVAIRCTEPNQNVLINEADNVGDSEDSEDEWNYYRVDPKEEKKEAGETNETNEENQESIEADEKGSNEHCILDFQKETKCGSSQDLPKLIDTEISLEEKQDKPEALKIPEGEGIESEEDMEFHLNPDAAEFVPVSPSLIGTRVNLQDFPISGSPLKQAPIMDDIAIPSQREFDEEVCKRPSEMDETNCSNGDQENHECLQNKNLLDESDFSSTKAEFGDESHIRFVTATDMRSDFSALDSSFTSCDRDDYDIAKDPMAMSFTPSDFEAALEKPVDLNAVHNLDESMDERDIFDNVSTPLQKDFEMFSSNFEKTEEPREKEIQIMETKLPQSPMEPDSSNGEMLLDLPQESVEPQQNLFQIDESEDIVSKMENVHIGGSSEISSTVHPELLNLDSEQSFYEKQSMESEFQNEETSSLKNLDVGEQKDLDFGVESESKSQDEEVTEPITDSVPNIPVDDTLQSEMMDEQQPTTASSMELAGGVDNRGFHDDFMFTDNVTSTKTEVEEFATKDFVPDSPEQDVGKSTIGFSEAVEENQKHTCLTEPLDDAQTKNFVEITGDIQKNIMSLSDSMQEFTGLEQQLQPQLGTNPFLEAETTVDVEKEVSAEIEVTPEASVTEDTTEKNKIESLATVAAAAVAVTATASSVAAKSKKSAPKTSLRTSTPVKAAPKSSQSSPTKTVSCTTKTTTLATKKPTTASRPKQLDTKPTASQAAAKPTAKAPVKTTVKTATTSGRPSTATGTTARTSTGTTLASRPLTSTTKTSIGSRTVNAAKKAPLATSKPAATLEKKSLSNGEMKTLNKSASTRPPTKLTTTTTRTTTLNKVASKPATTSIAKPKPPAGAQTKPSTISLNKATPTSPSVVAKTRLVAAKSPMTDKQIKETANKQISQARTSTSTLSKPRTSGATSTTTSKRLTAVSKTSNTSMPSKKLPPTSKTTTKSSATTKVTRVSNTKTTVLQNGITAKAEVTNTLITESKVEEDLPKKDLSPVLTPTDNQLNVIAD